MNDELKHYGVLGMKWGVRKSVSGYKRAGMLTKKRQLAKDKKDLEKVQSGKGKSVGFIKKKSKQKTKKKRTISDMSNEELKSRNQRLQLESQYKSLSSQSTSSGKKFVTSFVEGTGKATQTAVQTAIATAAVSAGKKLIQEKLKKAS